MTRRVPGPSDRLHAVLPLTPVVMHILLALVDQPRHGLGIAAHVDEFSGGRVVMGPGTLYGAIKRLLDFGLINDRVETRSADAIDPRRRYYAITPLGRRALEVEARQLADVLNVARLKGVLR
jgi:DNA-binding PadR family transcriptional regulator